MYTENSWEFGKVGEALSWNHQTSTRHRSEINGIADRAVRRIKEGTSAALLQSRLGQKWWFSLECYCYLRKVQNFLSDGKKHFMNGDLKNHSEGPLFFSDR